MQLTLGADHAGFPLKQNVKDTLENLGHTVIDVGTYSEDPVDFPDIARDVTAPVLAKEADRGILVCGSGVGATIAANKIPGIRAVTAHDTYSARQSVEHDDVNVLSIGAWLIGPAIVEQVLKAFLEATFSSDADCRRRVEKLHQLEREHATGSAE